MSYIHFFRNSHRLQLLSGSHEVVGTWEAYNNVDSKSKGIWPDGRYVFSHFVRHKGLDENSSYGTRGVYVFHVSGREGMGVHAGRKNAKRQPGPAHWTYGCIRTTEEAMAAIEAAHASDKLTHISLGRLGDFVSPSKMTAMA